MTHQKVTLSQLASTAYSNAEKLNEWTVKCRQIQHQLELMGEDTQDAVGIADALCEKLCGAYDKALDLAVQLTKMLKWRLFSSDNGSEPPPAA